MSAKDYTSKKFGKLTAIKRIAKKYHATKYLCTCDCGNETVVTGCALVTGNTKSCGCIHEEIFLKIITKHGAVKNGIKHNLYCVWSSMLSRCNNKKNTNYHNYGGRGISVCKEWNEDFWQFVSDMGARKENHTLDRINNNKNYSPENCRWVTQPEQLRNTRRNHYITFNGETRCITDWAKHIGINTSGMIYRINNWTTERALTESNNRNKL